MYIRQSQILVRNSVILFRVSRIIIGYSTSNLTVIRFSSGSIIAFFFFFFNRFFWFFRNCQIYFISFFLSLSIVIIFPNNNGFFLTTSRNYIVVIIRKSNISNLGRVTGIFYEGTVRSGTRVFE